MNKQELIREVARRCEAPLDNVREHVETLIDVVIDTVASGEDIYVRDIGRLTTRTRSASRRKHPRTGEYIDIPERVVAVFKPAKSLIERVNSQ